MSKKENLKIKKTLKHLIRVCKKTKDKKNEMFYSWVLQGL